MSNHTNDRGPATSERDLGATLIVYVDELDLAHDAIDGTAAMLDMLAASNQYDDNIRHAFTAMAQTLNRSAVRVFDVCRELDAMAKSAPQVASDGPDGSKGTAGVRVAIGQAQVDALSAKEALDRLSSLVIAGELDVSTDAGVDAFACFVDGIGGRIREVAAVLGGIAYGAED